jgi:hypothetical protein
MLPRLSQFARHFPKPGPCLGHISAAPGSQSGASGVASKIMASALADGSKARTIHTAACLIIGDEVLGGKVRCFLIHAITG